MQKTLQKVIVLFVLGFFTYTANAQYNEVIRASNYGGVSNVNYNPAIADNRFKFDLNLVSLGFGVSNNYIGVSNTVFNSLTSTTKRSAVFNDANFQSDYLHERVNGKGKAVYQNLQVQGPLSFMFSWGKNRSNKNAIALTWNVNEIFSLSGVNEKLARDAYWGLGAKADSISGFNYKQLQNKNFGIRAMVWNDYGITYSRVLLDKGKHMLKAGATLKILQGLASGYAYSKNIDYKFNGYDTLNIYNSDLTYGHDKYTEKFYNKSSSVSSSDVKDIFKLQQAALSAAVDLGVIYEYRPNKDKYKYTMDCKDYYRNDKDKYLIQAGASVIDLGAITYKKTTYARDYFANINNWYVKGEPIKDVHSFDSVLHSKFAVSDSSSKFTVWLPTRINLFADVNIYKGLGVNLNAQISPTFASVKNQVVYPSRVTLTPRFDHKWVGVYLPLSVDFHGNFGAGFGLRAGPLFVSSSNIISMAAQKWNYAFNMQVGLKISIPNGKLKDHDKDGVSNRLDKCKREKGTCETHGCADKDNDGVMDKDDKCPDVAGPVELNGCPDRDKDGITDAQDDCPDVAGPKELKGCPDTDGDGILDKDDECPTEKGVKELAGCPDRDGDGVADKVDACPDVAGDKAHAGCPDSDKDGLYDNVDKCPRQAGPAENNGCPYPDTDGDGVLDKDDACVTVPGLASNKGCPALEKKEMETLNFAFKNLEFETGKDVIRKTSYPSLNSLAEVLVKKGYGLKIEGHTDNVGKAEANLDLSKRRAAAVKTYLENKGVAANKMEPNGFGDTKPVGDNKTVAGRQKNRRVEMNILFK